MGCKNMVMATEYGAFNKRGCVISIAMVMTTILSSDYKNINMEYGMEYGMRNMEWIWLELSDVALR